MLAREGARDDDIGGEEEEEDDDDRGGDNPELTGEVKVNPRLKGKDERPGGGSGGGRGAFVETLDVVHSSRSPSSQCCKFQAAYPSSTSS